MCSAVKNLEFWIFPLLWIMQNPKRKNWWWWLAADWFFILATAEKIKLHKFYSRVMKWCTFYLHKITIIKKRTFEKKKKVIGRTFMATKIMQTTVKVYKITFSSPPQNLFFLSPLPNVISVKCTFFITCYGIMVARGGCRELIGENIII